MLIFFSFDFTGSAIFTNATVAPAPNTVNMASRLSDLEAHIASQDAKIEALTQQTRKAEEFAQSQHAARALLEAEREKHSKQTAALMADFAFNFMKRRQPSSRASDDDSSSDSEDEGERRAKQPRGSAAQKQPRKSVGGKTYNKEKLAAQYLTAAIAAKNKELDDDDDDTDSEPVPAVPVDEDVDDDGLFGNGEALDLHELRAEFSSPASAMSVSSSTAVSSPMAMPFDQDDIDDEVAMFAGGRPRSVAVYDNDDSSDSDDEEECTVDIPLLNRPAVAAKTVPEGVRAAAAEEDIVVEADDASSSGSVEIISQGSALSVAPDNRKKTYTPGNVNCEKDGWKKVDPFAFWRVIAQDMKGFSDAEKKKVAKLLFTMELSRSHLSTPALKKDRLRVNKAGKTCVYQAGVYKKMSALERSLISNGFFVLPSFKEGKTVIANTVVLVEPRSARTPYDVDELELAADWDALQLVMAGARAMTPMAFADTVNVMGRMEKACGSLVWAFSKLNTKMLEYASNDHEWMNEDHKAAWKNLEVNSVPLTQRFQSKQSRVYKSWRIDSDESFRKALRDSLKEAVVAVDSAQAHRKALHECRPVVADN